ncbi:MAG: hypothetical protein EBT47_00650 [Chloroflexi bacterium]|nr:hypothetical protein [Chloroflexota bacterium]
MDVLEVLPDRVGLDRTTVRIGTYSRNWRTIASLPVSRTSFSSSYRSSMSCIRTYPTSRPRSKRSSKPAIVGMGYELPGVNGTLTCARRDPPLVARGLRPAGLLATVIDDIFIQSSTGADAHCAAPRPWCLIAHITPHCGRFPTGSPPSVPRPYPAYAHGTTPVSL